jgi:hypothetical protein
MTIPASIRRAAQPGFCSVLVEDVLYALRTSVPFAANLIRIGGGVKEPIARQSI